MYRFDPERSTKGEVLNALEEKHTLYKASLLGLAREIGMKIQELLGQKIMEEEFDERLYLRGVGPDSSMKIGVEYEIDCTSLILGEYELELETPKLKDVWDKVEDWLYSEWVEHPPKNWDVDVECQDDGHVVFDFYHHNQ